MNGNNLRDYISAEELTQIKSRSSLKATSNVLYDWTVIIGLLVLVGLYSNPLTYLVVVIFLGGR